MKKKKRKERKRSILGRARPVRWPHRIPLPGGRRCAVLMPLDAQSENYSFLGQVELHIFDEILLCASFLRISGI